MHECKFSKQFIIDILSIIFGFFRFEKKKTCRSIIDLEGDKKMKLCEHGDLMIFSDNELLYSKQETWQILVYFFGGNAKSKPSWMGNIERSFAQALFLQAIQMSHGMRWINRIFNNMIAPSATIYSLISVTIKEGAKQGWLDRRLKYKPVIYQKVVGNLAWVHRPTWEIRADEMRRNLLDGSEVNEKLSDPFYCEFKKK